VEDTDDLLADLAQAMEGLPARGKREAASGKPQAAKAASGKHKATARAGR
jgi:hypothetical protein